MAEQKPFQEKRDDALAMRSASEKVWVMKVPRFLMDHLGSSTPGAGCGTVTADGEVGAGAASSSGAGAAGVPPGAASTYTLTLPSEGLPEGLPREYELRFTAAPPATYVFSRDADGGAPAHEGRIEARGEIRPKELNKEYRSLIAQRGAAAAQPQRTMMAIEDDKALKRERLNHRQVQQDERQGRIKRVAQREQTAAKKARPQLSARELKERLKELLTQRTYWSRRELVAELGNAGSMGALLEELCDKVTKKGPRYGDYSLKQALRTGLPAAPMP